MTAAVGPYDDPLGSAPGGSRLQGKVALLVGAGQTPGLSIGNGRAAAVLYAREGARLFCVDRDLDSASETAAAITAEGGEATAFRADVTREDEVAALVAGCVEHFGRIDILHNNVGAGLALGDAPVADVDSDAFDRVMAVNLRSMVITCKHALPVLRAQRSGVILNISSFAAYSNYPYIAYKTSKAGVIALTQNLAISNAEYNIRANVVVPGLINTPMAVDNRIGVIGDSREEVIAKRDAQVPLNQKMGTAWDVAHAALYLCSDEASFITGVSLVVDGGQSLRIG
ncbi:MAG TPA: SDR family NAD(P)-dependent oxidoreductase [Acidimicrobiales bacterium]|nr:SDR family NAD(P)-dependent oxidoreductase [Acidimicrobiales bacterium]